MKGKRLKKFKKKCTPVKDLENSGNVQNSKHNNDIDSRHTGHNSPKEQKKRPVFVKRKKFPFNIETWKGTSSDNSGTSIASEDKNFDDESTTTGTFSENPESNRNKPKGDFYIYSRAKKNKCLIETKKPYLKLEDIDNRYDLGKSFMYAWSSVTDMDNTSTVNEQYRENLTSLNTSINDRISRKLKEQSLISASEEDISNMNNNSFVIKSQNLRDEATQESGSGFPTYLTEGNDSESIGTITSSMSIPIPGNVENPITNTTETKEVTEPSENGFLRLLSWCCLSLRSDSDSHTWSKQDAYVRSCEGDTNPSKRIHKALGLSDCDHKSSLTKEV